MHTVVILETDPKTADVLQSQLEKRQFQTTVFARLNEARQALQSNTPDLLLIDLNVADQDFTSFYQWLLSDPTYQHVPRLFIEGTSRAQAAQAIRSQSGDPILKKPLRLSQLLSEMHTLIERKQPAAQPPSHSHAPLPAEPDPQDEVNRRLSAFIGSSIGNVVLQKEIGRGGMGAVFLGRQTTLDRAVAVKVMLPDLVGQGSALARFQREALAIARLKSPHIVQVFDAGTTTDGTFYITMEFLEGGTVDDHLQMQTRCTTQQTIDILCQVLLGLEVAHNAGLIHRDLKPSNLMINDSGHVTITDFGLVREHGVDETDKLTKQGSLLGTPYYLSPEQATGAQLGPRTDLYSLGIIGYELLVGEVPFTSHNLLDILVMHHNLPLPDPRAKIKSGIPEELVAILMRMAAKKPDERFLNATEVLQALRSLHIQPSQPMPHQYAPNPVLPSISPAAQGRFKLTTNSDNRLQHFSSQSDVTLDRENAVGKAVVRASGEVFERQGTFPDTWVRALSICVGVIQQLQTLPGLGQWSFAQIEAPDHILHIHPHMDMYESILLHPDKNRASMNLSAHAAPALNPSSTVVDPFVHISSIAGVLGILMFDSSGHLTQAHYNTQTDEELIRVRLAPLPQLLQSIPISFVGIDATYEQGRVFLWDMDDQTLFVITTPHVNKTVLTMSLASQLMLLKGKRQDPRTLSRSIYPELPANETVPTELMKQIKKEFARSIGPIADLTIKKEAKRMGFSRKQFPKEKLHELLQRLSNPLDASKQQDFLDKANALVDQHTP
jgi:serine/threonine protein kinase/ActR/RegA family two-component response regulator